MINNNSEEKEPYNTPKGVSKKSGDCGAKEENKKEEERFVRFASLFEGFLLYVKAKQKIRFLYSNLLGKKANIISK